MWFFEKLSFSNVNLISDADKRNFPKYSYSRVNKSKQLKNMCMKSVQLPVFVWNRSKLLRNPEAKPKTAATTFCIYTASIYKAAERQLFVLCVNTFVHHQYMWLWLAYNIFTLLVVYMRRFYTSTQNTFIYVIFLLVLFRYFFFHIFIYIIISYFIEYLDLHYPKHHHLYRYVS